MRTTSPRRPRRNAAQWAALVEQSNSTSLSLWEFCERENVPLRGLYFWRSKLRASQKPEAGGFTPVRLRKRLRTVAEPPPQTAGTVEVSLRNGRVVRVVGAVDVRVLQTVIMAAEGGGAC